jgi:hypothetical protein
MIEVIDDFLPFNQYKQVVEYCYRLKYETFYSCYN